MRSILPIAILAFAFLITDIRAQDTSSPIVIPPPGEAVNPPATTGTAPIDTGLPTGTGTTGTSGVTMEEAAENYTGGKALMWIAIFAAFAIVLIMMLRRSKRKA